MELLNYLKSEPKARERRHKNRAIGNIIAEEYGLKTIFIDKNRMADMVGEILSLDRKWRKILEDNPELRGSDYSQKEVLEQSKMLELGYEVNYESNVAKLKTL